MTSCYRRLRMPWSGATGAIARCKNRSIGSARKHRSGHDWHWTCGEKPKAKGAIKPSTLYMKHVQAEVTRYPRYSLHNQQYSALLAGSLQLRQEAARSRLCSRQCSDTTVVTLRTYKV